MRTWFAVAAGVVLLSTVVVPAGTVQAKEPPQPAFGKELVPDQQAQKDPKSAEIEEELHDKEDEGAVRSPRRSGGHGKRVHIQLDGDEDGGGSDDESGDF